MSDKIALRQQVAAVRAEIEQRKLSRGKMSRSEVEYQLARLEAAASTLDWLQANGARIKAALAS